MDDSECIVTCTASSGSVEAVDAVDAVDAVAMPFSNSATLRKTSSIVEQLTPHAATSGRDSSRLSTSGKDARWDAGTA